MVYLVCSAGKIQKKSLLIELLSNLSEGTELIPGQIMILITQINANECILRAFILSFN